MLEVVMESDQANTTSQSECTFLCRPLPLLFLLVPVSPLPQPRKQDGGGNCKEKRPVQESSTPREENTDSAIFSGKMMPNHWISHF